MSEIILNWLNDQLQLSKRISNFQQDFNNGYLLGQILSKYNQQLNFSQFSNRDDKKSKIKNFQLLFDTFSSLGVTFDSLVANQIINRKTGVAKKLLYELKMHLQKTNSNAFTKITKMTKTLSPLKKLKVSKQQYDKVDKDHFVKQLNELHPAQKTLNQQKLLKKFSDFHQQQVNLNTQLSEKDQQGKLIDRKRFRQKQRQNLKKTADFRNEWQRNNIQKWQTNMTVRQMQNDKDNMFKTKLQQTKFQNRTMSQIHAIKAMDKDLNEFQRKFLKGSNKKKNIIQDSDDSQQQQQVSSNLNQIDLKKKESKLSSKLKFSSTGIAQGGNLETSVKKKKVPHQVTEQQKHQRQKKRRKMIVQQNKRYQLIEISRRQKYILSTIQQTSKQQKQLQYEIWRVWQNKEIIKENKKLQDQKQKQKNQTRDINAKFKRDQLLKSYREQHQKEVQDSVKRQQKLLKEKKVMERKQTYNQCKKMVQKCIEISQKCFLLQQQKNQTEIDQKFLQHLFQQFIQDVENKQDVAKLEVQNYIHGKGEWDLPVKRKTEDQPKDPVQQNALPENVVNNYGLGNILRILYENKFKQNHKKQNNSNESTQKTDISSQYIFSLLGLEFSGKHLAAEAIKKMHNFNVVQIDKLIYKKIQQYQNMKDKVSQTSQLTKKLVDFAYNGKKIPNQIINQLILEDIRQNPKSILINFPTTYNQALQLTKSLTGVQPSDFQSITPLKQKVNSFSRLVCPTESKIVERPIKQCGVDLALWVDIKDQVSYDRFLGRRTLDGKTVHISQEISQKVNRLKVGQKATSQILKNYEKLIQKQKLCQFFNEFGIQISEQKTKQQKAQEQQRFRQQGQGQQTNQGQQDNNKNFQQQNSKNQIQKVVKKTWQTIDGHGSISQIQERILSVLKQSMHIKELKQQQLKKIVQQKQLQKVKVQETQKLEEELKQKCVLSNPQEIKEKTKKAIDSVQFNDQFISQLCSLWQSIQNSTIQSLTRVFGKFFNQKQQQDEYFSSLKRNFINLLTRQDKKFSIVKQFQMNYNKFYDQNKEMISQQYTKQQLHQRVDDLEDILFEIIELKKQDAIQQRKSTVESGWIESQLEQFHNCFRILLQAQLNRYNASQKIISDFYSKKFGVSQNPLQETNAQINYDTSLQMVTKQGAYPRFEKLISQTQRIFNKQEQIVDDKNKKGGKAPPGKKDQKKGGKKGDVQQVKEPTPQQLEMKKLINIQKSIFRYRLSIINEYSTRKISSLVKQNENLSKSLEAYYQYTFEVENKCVLNLSKIFRSKIENQQKIEKQVQVNYVDVVELQAIRNFYQQKPTVLPAQEFIKQDGFTVSSLKEVIQFIQNQSQSLEKISNRRLIYVLSYLQNNQKEKQLLPKSWKKLNTTNLQFFATRLENQNLGFIELWKIFIFLLMSNFLVPSQKTIQQYFNDLTTFGTQKQIDRQKLISTPAWFDEAYQQKHNVRTFRRNEHIKEILFETFKRKKGDGLEYLDGQDLIRNLKLEWFTGGDQKMQNRTYFSLGFE